ncbi:hypothetical protein ABW20_dc0110622 [Dactylellina cionopaga]|nr:hypothetical protein ABW20_dc0110622 [Dactylellina cionopaga]
MGLLYTLCVDIVVAALVGVVVIVSTARATASCSTSASSTPVCLNLQNCTNVDAWGLQVEVGTSTNGQARQSLCLVPSTVINATYVLGSEICNNDGLNKTCEASHGGTFDRNAISGFTSQTTSASDGVESFWDDLNGPVETFGAVGFAVAGFTELKDYEIGVVTNGTKFNLGQLGLGPKSSFLHSLKSQGFIDRLIFGFDAGSQSPYNPRPGHIVLGGYDQSRIAGNFAEFDINYEDTEFRPCPFRVEIQKVDVLFETDMTTTAFIDMESRNPYACIEPYDNLFRFPSGRLASLDSIGLGAGKVPSDWLPNLQVNEPGWRYKAGSPGPFSLNIALRGNDEDFQIVIPNEELEHPLRGIDQNGTYAVNRNYTELNIFQESAVRNTIVLGKAFLSQVYLLVDYEAGKFYLAASSPSLAGCNPVPFGCTDDGSLRDKQNKIAGYIGLAFGAVAFLIIVVVLGLAIWFWKSGKLDRYRRRGVTITERDMDCGTYSQQNTQNMRKIARQASIRPCSESPDRQTVGSTVGVRGTEI